MRILLHKLVLHYISHILLHGPLCLIVLINLQSFQYSIIIILIQLTNKIILYIIMKQITKYWNFHKFLWNLVRSLEILLDLHDDGVIVTVESKFNLLLAIEFIYVVIVNLDDQTVTFQTLRLVHNNPTVVFDKIQQKLLRCWNLELVWNMKHDWNHSKSLMIFVENFLLRANDGLIHFK